jgi:hypothetical protein
MLLFLSAGLGEKNWELLCQQDQVVECEVLSKFGHKTSLRPNTGRGGGRWVRKSLQRASDVEEQD